MAGGRAFCSVRQLCLLLFIYLSFAALLNLNRLRMFAYTPGLMFYVSQQASSTLVPKQSSSKVWKFGFSGPC